MKQLTTLMSIAIICLLYLNTEAQIKMPKAAKDLAKDMNVSSDVLSKELVKAINPGDALGISADKLLKLENNNKSYVNDLLEIFGGSACDTEKTAKAEAAQKERKDFVSSLLGEGKAAQYYKLIKPQVEPLIKKYALAKFLL